MIADNRRLYDCSNCQENPMFYQQLGHDDKPYGLWDKNLVTGQELQRCPVRDLLDADARTLHEVNTHRVELYPLFRKGHLLVAGGIADQPALYVDYMRHCDSLSDAVEARILKEQQQPPEEDPLQ